MATKTCTKCNETKPLSDFYKKAHKTADGHDYYCKLCRRSLQQTWSDNNRDRYRATKRESQRRLKREVIAAYGNKCACCGETILAFLSLDHVHGGGTQHRKLTGSSQTPYRDARNRNFPPDYQVLCFNCNWAKHFLGKCPHAEMEKS